MHLRKKTVSLIVIVLLLVNLFSSSAYAADSTDYVRKLDETLQKELAVLNNDDTISVALWLSDIDQNKVEEQLEDRLEEEAAKGNLSEKAVFLSDKRMKEKEAQLTGSAISKINTSTYGESNIFADQVVSLQDQLIKAETYTQREKNKILGGLTSDDAQFYIEEKRNISKIQYDENNNSIVKELFSTKSHKSVAAEDLQIIYQGQYSPIVLVKLTKGQLMNIIQSDKIDSAYSFDPDAEPVEDIDLPVLEDNAIVPAAAGYPYGVWQTITGIDDYRDTWGFDGTGVKIGTVETPNKSLRVFANSQNKITILSGSATDHGSYTTSILMGNIDGYKGVVPNAQIYCAGSGSLYERVETLIDQGVSIITSSVSWIESYNQYSAYAKWLDHVAVQHNVTFIKSAGNYGADNVPSMNMAFNIIAVGNINDKDTLTTTDDILNSTSSYTTKAISSPSTAYKPDISAPGAYVKTLSHPNMNGNGGTSAAAPVVAGIAAQLCTEYPVLKTAPLLLKAILLAGAERIDNMTDVSEKMGFISLSPSYGAGVAKLSVSDAIMEHGDYSYSSTPRTTLNLQFDAWRSGRRASVCLVSEKPNTVNCVTGAVNNNPGIEYVLSVSQLNGTLVKTSSYAYDSKQFVSFLTPIMGDYSLRVFPKYGGDTGTKIAVAYYVR